MQTTSQTWRDLWAAGAPLEARATVNGTVYEGVAPVIHRATMQDSLSVGNVVSASLALALREAGSVPRSAAVAVEARLNDGVTASEWLPQGTFYISRRARDPVTGTLALECYDALLKANALWTPSAGAWPRTMAAVTAELASLLGVAVDSRTVIPTGAAYVVSEPAAGTTIRDALSTIAQAGGGNWIITPVGLLRLVRLGEAGGAVDVAGVVGGIEVAPAGAVTGVRDSWEEDVYLNGDDTGIVVDVSLPPVIAADVAEALIGLSYQPYSLAGAIYDPAAELGDSVRAGAGGEVSSVLCSEQATLGPAFRGDIAAPAPGEVTDEYPYIGGAEKTLALARAAVAEAVEQLDDALTQQEIFNRLTDNGAAQGLVLYNGQLYVNASYINAGRLSVGFLDFTNYAQPYRVPNEYDSDSMLPGEHIENGWIVSNNPEVETWGMVRVISCANAVPIRGQTIVVTATTKGHVDGGEWECYTGTSWNIGSWVAPSYGHEDADGDMTGAIAEGEYERFSYTWVVPNDAKSFSISFECSGVRSIVVSEEFSQYFGLRYGNNIGINYKGLQVGKFVVDRSGNVTFNGDAKFNGNVSGITSADVGALPDTTTPADIGAVSTSDVIDLPHGGTGANTAENARANLGLGYSTGTVTSTYGTIAYFINGCVCTVKMNVSGIAVTGWTNIASNLPKPATSFYFVVFGTTTQKACSVNIQADGTLRFNGRGTEAATVDSITYVLAN